jgi:hypothetical protein
MYQRANGEIKKMYQEHNGMMGNGTIERWSNETYGSMQYWTQRKTVPGRQWNDGEWNDGTMERCKIMDTLSLRNR